uniref:Integrase, catalytic region, zinc finger, CCHC-type, peptidase aspartic, catalytic n=1 Tax=Tanacetum cinerariifolium TaxID=118510 RepID=A0A6L2LTT4_TANCI|nr:integrase, catalytic region, zinc finger, CCHC-type, peptidase aspartic, catalytic [Tanacetum cinerariifolium]
MKRLFDESITTWELFRKAFLNEYRPPLKIIKQIASIMNFKQEPNDPFHCSWERFIKSIFICPEHKLSEHEQLRIFYQGLDTKTRRKVDFKGSIPRMTPTKGMEAIKELFAHSLSWGLAHAITTKRGLNYKLLKNPLENITNPQDKPETKEKASKNVEEASDDHRKSIESCNQTIPFPGRLKKGNEKEQFRKFFENLQQLSINIPFFEALEQMPKYAKFMKDLLVRKPGTRKLNEEAIRDSFPDKHLVAVHVREAVNDPWKESADKLDDALWEFRTAYKSPTRSTPFRIVYGKACHLPTEMEHKAYWALKNVNLNLDTAGKHRISQQGIGIQSLIGSLSCGKQGESINVQDLETNLYWEFGKFSSHEGESIESYYSRFYKMMNELIRNQYNVTNHQVNVQFLLQLQPKWQRFMTLVKQSQVLKTVSYQKLYDILKQHQNEVNEIRAERIARTANPLALVAQQQPDNSPRINRGAGYDKQRASLLRDDTDDESEDQKLEAHYMYMAQIQEVSLDAADSRPIFDTEPLQKIEQNDDDNDFANEQANNKLSETNKLLYNDFKKSQAELERRNDVEYASKVEIDCAKAKGDLISYKMESQKSFNKYTQTINDLNQMIFEMKKKLSAHQETISILSQLKEAQIKLYKTRKDKELDKVIALENKVKKAQRANPRLYDIGCYNDNLALMLAPESEEVIRLEKESRSKLSDLIRTFYYEKLNNLYDLFVPQREKSSQQRYFSERSRMSHTPINNGNSKESFNKQIILLEKRMDESISWDQKCKSSKELFKIKRSTGMIFDGVERCKETIAIRTYFGQIDPFIQNIIEANFGPEIRKINADLEKFHVCLKEKMVANVRYFNSLELEVDSLKSQLETQKTQFLNVIDRLLRKYYYADHMNAILGVYTELDEVTNLQCDYLELLEKCECFEKELSKSQMMSKSFEALQKHVINLEIDLQQFIRQPNAFKSKRPSILGKPTIFSDSLKRKDFSKSKSVIKNNVSNDLSKPVTAQILPTNKKSILKNTNVLALGMYKLHTNPTQTRTSQLHQDSRKTNKRVSFSTGVIPTTSVSRPQLKSNSIEERVLLNNSQGKTQEVEDHRRNVKFSKNKMSVIACHDNLNVKTVNVNFVCATCEIVLFIVDFGCSKHMTGNLKLLINFVEKFLGTVKFRNDQIAPILGYGDLVQGAVMIKWVYYVEGLNHNLFSVDQFCDADLEVAFQKSTCYIRDLKGNDLLTSSHGTDLYSITLQDTNSPDPICLMAKATSSQAWLWHRRLSHLNFDTINLLSKNDIVVGLPKLKFVKDHICSSWILHQTSVAQTPKQNGVVERRNRTLVEAARTMLSTAKVPLFFWAEAIATTCFTQNHSLVIPHHEKTPYHIINDQKPSVKFFYIFGSLCYIIRDGENLDKMKEKGDACIFVGYSTQSRAYRVFNKRSRGIVETIHVNFDELPQMASDHVSSNLGPQCQRTALEHDSLSPDLQCQENVTQAERTVTTSNELDLLFYLMFDELLNGSSQVMSKSSTVTTTEALLALNQSMQDRS